MAPPSAEVAAPKGKALKKENRTLRRELLSIYDETDAKIQKGLKTAAVSCTKGCTACCNQLVFVEMSEAALIWHRHRDAVRSLLPQLLEQALAEESAAKVLDVRSTQSEMVSACRKYWLLQRPCVFLTQDRLCAVYASRPLACRTHFVVSPPEECGRAISGPVKIIDVADQRMTAALGLARKALEVRNGAILAGSLARMMAELSGRTGDDS